MHYCKLCFQQTPEEATKNPTVKFIDKKTNEEIVVHYDCIDKEIRDKLNQHENLPDHFAIQRIENVIYERAKSSKPRGFSISHAEFRRLEAAFENEVLVKPSLAIALVNALYPIKKTNKLQTQDTEVTFPVAQARMADVTAA